MNNFIVSSESRVNQMLKNVGVDKNKEIVIYAEIEMIFVYLLGFFAVGGIGIIINTIQDIGIVYFVSIFVFIILPILSVIYYFWASKSYSFAILEDKIYAINPNYPFKSLVKIDKSDIKRVKVGQDRLYGLSFLFLSFYNYYLEVETADETYQFYCYPLENEHYDNFEGWETQTSDGLEYQLKQKGYFLSD